MPKPSEISWKFQLIMFNDRKTMPGGQGYLMYSNASSSISAIGNIFAGRSLSGSSHGDLHHDDALCR